MNATPAFGPSLQDDGVTFRLWAPAAQNVEVEIDRLIEMKREGGWFFATVDGRGAGTRYRFIIDGEIAIPDPASHFQPGDVHGRSEVIDHRYAWQNRDWRGRPWHEAVFSEIHIGTYTPQGTYRGVVGKLDHLVQTGITAIELMPLADFPGRWNWGYDGVLPFAPDSTYGRPEDLKALIDSAHARDLMVFLDVVYNHFGPEGNYLHQIAPDFFSDVQTPWGGAINYEQPEVRAFVIENALHWLEHYRLDGLRLDAVHAIMKPGRPEILADLSAAVGKFAAASGRFIHLVLENDDNRASLLLPQENPPAGHYRAQWNDDYHHAWHVLLTNEDQGYYRDYLDPRKHIVRTLSEGFAYQGEPSSHRGGSARGEPSRTLPREAFINFIQNHDQIGNRPLGDRMTVLAKPEAVKAALSVLLLQPSPPLLFMGEEWGATEPFPFFCDFQGDLAEAVRQGRRNEFAEAYAEYGNEIPDPLAQTTHDSARLDWDALNDAAHAQSLEHTKALLTARRRNVVPLLPAINDAGQACFCGSVLTAQWTALDKVLLLLANLSDKHETAPDIRWGEPIWGGPLAIHLPAWSVFAAIRSE